MKKIGFVVPWYGEKIPGGAEMLTRELVKHLDQAGVELEVLTTCVEKFASDWNVDFHAPGVYLDGGITVRRFPVRKRDIIAFDKVNYQLMCKKQISLEEEQVFLREMINSPSLYTYMREHVNEYSFFVMLPYMFGTTYYGSMVCPEKTVLIPCFHDEPYAHMRLFKETFSKVRGMVFNASPEKELAERVYSVSGENFVTFGLGVDENFDANPTRFRNQYQIASPFVLYAGRKEAGKKVDVLLQYFVEYKRRNPSDLKLVLIGGGEIKSSCADIIDLGFVPVQDKYDAYAAATLFCNPSEMESFSIVIMESWLANRPVLVNGDCEVTKDFVIKMNGGLYYQNYWEFEACLNYLFEHSDVANQMGRNGSSYVRANFTWDVVTKRYIEYFRKLEKESQ